MKRIEVRTATTNAGKKATTGEAFEYCFGSEAEMTGQKASSDSPDQPTGMQAVRGALQRMGYVYTPGSTGFCVSLESGTFSLPGHAAEIEFTVCVVRDPLGRQHVGLSNGYQIPPDFAERVRRGGFRDEQTYGKVLEVEWKAANPECENWDYVQCGSQGSMDRNVQLFNALLAALSDHDFPGQSAQWELRHAAPESFQVNPDSTDVMLWIASTNARNVYGCTLGAGRAGVLFGWNWSVKGRTTNPKIPRQPEDGEILWGTRFRREELLESACQGVICSPQSGLIQTPAGYFEITFAELFNTETGVSHLGSSPGIFIPPEIINHIRPAGFYQTSLGDHLREVMPSEYKDDYMLGLTRGRLSREQFLASAVDTALRTLPEGFWPE